MSSVSGLDQLCAAACDNELAPPDTGIPDEIKVREIEAYASVADLIHAAILANSGAASLKEIYEVCEEHGRIAYRRADGSRLITSNDHWKSLVRLALYTGGRFERVPSNGAYWPLAPAFRGTQAELVKVLVRADDRTQHIRATLALTPSSGRTILPKLTVEPVQNGTARQRRKRPGTAAGGGEGSVEGMCDSVDPMASGAAGAAAAAAAMRAPALRQRARLGDSGAPDNHSTQDEAFDEIRDLPRLRARRISRRPTWRAAAADDEDGHPGVMGGAGAAPLKMEEPERRSYEERPHNVNNNNNLISRESADPSSLRWGSTGLRSTIIISTADSSGLSAGRTPLVPRRHLGRARDTSAEADSAPKQHWRWNAAGGHGGMTGVEDAGQATAGPPPSKRQATLPPSGRGGLPTPPAMAEGPAQVTPPFMTQWAEAIQMQMEEAATAHQKSLAAAAGQTGAGNPWAHPATMGGAGGAPPGFPGGFPPMAMLPAMLPGLLAAAAPFFSSHHAQQQLQQQMQAVILGHSGAAAVAASGQPSFPSHAANPSVAVPETQFAATAEDCA